MGDLLREASTGKMADLIRDLWRILQRDEIKVSPTRQTNKKDSLAGDAARDSPPA